MYYFDCTAKMSHIIKLKQARTAKCCLANRCSLCIQTQILPYLFVHLTYPLPIYAQSKFLSSQQEWTLTKFQCKIQPLNVKLVIKIQMCWHGSPLRSCSSLSLSLSFFGWISSAISEREQLVNVHGSAPLITYLNITHKLKNILITCLKSAENTYMFPSEQYHNLFSSQQFSWFAFQCVCVCVSW